LFKRGDHGRIMTLEEFKQAWVEAGRSLDDLKLNHYKLNFNEEDYVIGFYAVIEGEYDFYGQMSLYPDVCEGWYTFTADGSECGGYFTVDEVKKAEIIAEREAEAKKPTSQDLLEAQVTWTALMTDTLLETEEEF